MMPAGFEYVASPLAGLKVFERRPVCDKRGEFDRLFDSAALAAVGADSQVRQVNYVTNIRKGTVRGLHYQKQPYQETKTVTCLHGKAFDVVVDVRIGSPTFLQYHFEILDPEGLKTFVIPAGFAHGYQTMEDDTGLLYCSSNDFSPNSEGGLNPFDEALGIQWPLALTEISDRDYGCPKITSLWKGI